MRDYPVIQAEILLFSLEFILINLVVDGLYAAINPGGQVQVAMRLFNWRRQAVLNAMPLVKPDQYVHRGMNSGDDFGLSAYGDDRIIRYFIDCGGHFARWIAPYDAENYFDYDNLNNGPSLQHWFGVDSLGRDIFSRVPLVRKSRYGGRLPCLSVRDRRCWACSLDIMKAGGIPLIMRICDVPFAFPGILLRRSLLLRCWEAALLT